MHLRLSPCRHHSAIDPGALRLTSQCLVLFAILGLTTWLIPRYALSADPFQTGTDSGAEILQVDADQFDRDFNRNEISALGHVTLTYRHMRLTADQVQYNHVSRQAWAMGNVKLLSGKSLLTGDKLELDLNQETGTLFNGSIFLDENHFYITADEIRKTGPETYEASDAAITTCDGSNPDWRITGQSVDVTFEGYGSARHAALWARNVPLLYTPYWFFPAKTKRQSGLLFPEFDFSDRKGFQYRQAFFWAINTSNDATFFTDVMTLRGVRLGGEYRYALSPEAFGTFMLDGLNDAKVDDGTTYNGENYGYSDDAYLRPNSDRYWLRAKANQDLPGKVRAKLDLDWVSDQDYLQEIENGGFGFNQTQAYFRETFGRDLDDAYDTTRVNQLNLNRTWQHFSANGDLRWFDDVVQRRQGEVQDKVQQLPALQFSAIKQPIAALPLNYYLDTRYDHFYRQDGISGQRSDTAVGINLPLRLFSGLAIEPAVGLRQTFWQSHDDETVDTDTGDGHQQRSLYDLSLNMNSDLSRVYSSRLGGGNRVKHIINPKILYEYVSDTDQSTMALYDPLDRIAAKNAVTYGLTNTLVTSFLLPTQTNQPPAYGYRNFFRFHLEQSFDIQKSTDDEARPFSDILAELDFAPGPFLSLNTNAKWSPYDYRFNSLGTGLYLNDRRGNRLIVGYQFLRNEDQAQNTQSLNMQAQWQATAHWQLRANHERNLINDTAIETGLGLRYLSQCWSLGMDYNQQPEDWYLAIRVQLTGLGSMNF